MHKKLLPSLGNLSENSEDSSESKGELVSEGNSTASDMSGNNSDEIGKSIYRPVVTYGLFNLLQDKAALARQIMLCQSGGPMRYTVQRIHSPLEA